MPPRKRPGRVSIDRTEYDALIELRDITHARALRTIDELTATNRDQIARLVLADLRMTSILAELETLRRGKP